MADGTGRKRIHGLLRHCCSGGCQNIPGHRCDRPPSLELEEISEPGALEPTGPLAADVQTELTHLSGSTLTRNNKVRLLLDGTDSYGAMLDLIGSAEEEICFENFIFRADSVGRAFIAELRHRAEKDHLAVRVLHDPVGGRMSVLPVALHFRGSGARVRLFNPIPTGLGFFALGRDHRKLVVQDRRRLVAGGLCVADVWLGNCIRHCTWRDSAMLAEGECAALAAEEFDRLWSHGIALTWRGHGAQRSVPTFSPAADIGSVPIRVVADSRRRRATEKILVRVCNAARHEILITNQYFIPTTALRAALISAARKGVDVKLIVPRLARPMIAGLATDECLRGFFDSGIKVWRWNGPMMHAKTIVVDRSWLLVGSSNVDPQSLRFNAELNLEVHGEKIGEQMARVFAADLLTSTPYTYDDWRRRSLMWRALARLAGVVGPVL